MFFLFGFVWVWFVLVWIALLWFVLFVLFACLVAVGFVT